MPAKQIQHEVRKDSLAHGVSRHAPQHLRAVREIGFVFLQQAPPRHLLALIKQAHERVLRVGDVHGGEDKRRSVQEPISAAHVPQRRPVRVAADDV